MEAKPTGVRDRARTDLLVELLGQGLSKHAAGVGAGYSPGDAGNAAMRALSDPVISKRIAARLRKTAVTWHKLVTRAKVGLHRNLDPGNWESTIIKLTKADGTEYEQVLAAPVRASDINAAAKIVLDALRSIDAETLSEKAVKEDNAASAADLAREILGEHGVKGGSDE